MPYFHAKRAGFVVVQSQAFAFLIGLRLRNLRTCNASRASKFFFKQHHGAEDDADELEEGFDYDFHT